MAPRLLLNEDGVAPWRHRQQEAWTVIIISNAGILRYREK